MLLLRLDEVHEGPRQRQEYRNVEALAASIRSEGLLQPLVVRPREAGGYWLVAGGRRLRALRLLGWGEAPATLYAGQHPGAAELVENLQREDLTPVEKAGAILEELHAALSPLPHYADFRRPADPAPEHAALRVLYRLQTESRGRAREAVVGASPLAAAVEAFFAEIGLSWQSYLAHYAPLLKAPPEVQQLLRERPDVPLETARRVAQIRDPEVRREAVALVAEGGEGVGRRLGQVLREAREAREVAQLETRLEAAASTPAPAAQGGWLPPARRRHRPSANGAVVQLADGQRIYASAARGAERHPLPLPLVAQILARLPFAQPGQRAAVPFAGSGSLAAGLRELGYAVWAADLNPLQPWIAPAPAWQAPEEEVALLLLTPPALGLSAFPDLVERPLPGDMGAMEGEEYLQAWRAVLGAWTPRLGGRALLGLAEPVGGGLPDLAFPISGYLGEGPQLRLVGVEGDRAWVYSQWTLP